MSDERKDLTKSVVGRMIGDELAKIREEQAKRDAAQDAKIPRPSAAARAVGAAEKYDFTVANPKTSVAIALLIIVGSTTAHALKYLDTVPMYVLWGIAVCLIPGLAMKVVRLATGLKKAKDG